MSAKVAVRWRIVLGLGALATLAGAAALRVRGPEIPLLLPQGGARWIRFDRPLNLGIWRKRSTAGQFRVRFTIDEAPAEAVLTLRAFRTASVRLDGLPLFSSGADFAHWRTVHRVPLAPRLTPGPHTLEVSVFNRDGPPALLAYCVPLGLFTGTSAWESKEGDADWSSARPVDEIQAPALSRLFPRSDQALRAHLPLLATSFALVFAISWWGRPALRASLLRWLLLGAWACLLANNLLKVPLDVGFDAEGHLAYVRYVAERWRIPLATEGWEMFQAPLYYVLSAILYRCASSLLAPATSLDLLRVVPLLCGLAQVELSYRALRWAFPERDDLQGLGTLVGGLLPMNLYMSQYLGNETLAASLSAAAVVLTIRLLRQQRDARSSRRQWALGLLLGLAILTKVTAALLLFPVLLALAYALRDHDPWPATLVAATARVLGAVALVAGWYYLRNWRVLGSPVFGGWEPSRGIVWWQDPGYRTLRQLVSFGDALSYPIYSGVSGFWSAIFSSFWLDGYLGSMVTFEGRPPWNYGFVLAAPWLALLPATTIALGGLRAARGSVRAAHPEIVFALACVGTYLGTMLYTYLTLPIYAVAKATYTLGLTPCYALLAAAGLDCLTRQRLARAALYAGMACWGLFAYAAYLVR